MAGECETDGLSISLEDLGRMDRAAWERAYRMLYEAARNGVRSNAHSFPEADADELAAEAVVKMVGRVVVLCHEGRQWRDLLNMTFSTARHLSIDAYRKMVRRKTDVTAPAALPESARDQMPVPEIHRRWGVEEILAAVDTLQPPWPIIFRQRYLECREIGDIAAEHGLTYANTAQIFSRMNRQLRKILTEKEGGGA